MKNIAFVLLVLFNLNCLVKAEDLYVSKVWKSDNGDGTYTNPIIFADYSDPDVCASGSDYYMTASSFNCIPGLPILHSTDLVNWKIVNYALKKLEPDEYFSKPQHGKGVWAPSIKYHNGVFYIYWGDPDFGIYMIKSENPEKEWSKPLLIKAGKGMIDPTPLWDEDGKVYLANAWAGSRSGINSIITISEMNADGTSIISNPVIVFDGNDGVNHTVEGPKLYKRNGYYYIFAPAGGVATGWQIALRSKNIFGPYESKIVMSQGKSTINGPHQGAWIETSRGESWFIHFQDKAIYGRVVLLQPMIWNNDWPVIGEDIDGDGCGEPVSHFNKPNVESSNLIVNPVESDEFNTITPGLQWQWHANYKDYYGMPTNIGFYRLYANYLNEHFINFWEVPNIYLQKFPAEKFTATTKLRFTAKENGDKAGMIVMGWDYSYLSIEKLGEKVIISQTICKDADKQKAEKRKVITESNFDNILTVGSPNYIKDIYFQVKVDQGGECSFSFSFDGKLFKKTDIIFKARQGKWIGAKVGLFAVKPYNSGNRGWVDVDWFRISQN